MMDERYAFPMPVPGAVSKNSEPHSAGSTHSKATLFLVACLKFSGPTQQCPGLGGGESQVSIDGMNDTTYISIISYLGMCFDIH